MRRAVSAGGGAPESVAHVQTLLGNLEFERGRLGAARAAYGSTLAGVPAYPPASAGLAQLDAARGRFEPAIARLRRIVQRLPLPQYVVARGEAQLAAGRTTRRGATLRSSAQSSGCCAPTASTPTSTSRCSRPTTAARHER